MRKGLIYASVLCLLALALLAAADTGGKLSGDESDGSRAIPVHLIALLDEEGEKIAPDDEPLMPFSTRQTCSDCHINENVYHSYEKISKGWHFNVIDANVSPGRPGQPWILVDAGTATQIPLSYRRWPGTFRPELLGLTPWKFVQLFGRHMPGGGVGEIDSDNPDEVIRGFVSGKLEVNCLSCHNAHAGQDQAEYAGQIARQNFRWAAAGACEFASVSGSAKNMPDTYDPKMPELRDDTKLLAPTVVYRENTFDHKNQVFFDIVRKVPKERCYFCHSNIDLNSKGTEEWSTDEDVHLAAGLTCIDCHRHGIDHNITRGYEGEESFSTNPEAASLSCKGCHKGEESSAVPISGRLGAPVPEHRGIPPAHFDKLACTACHSGSWPAQMTYRTKTSRAHGLGTLNVNKSDDVLPHIMYPVFAEQQDGKIGPHKLIWPAFWGLLKAEVVTPINLEIVRQTIGKIIAKEKPPRSGDWPSLTAEHITKGLKLLSSQKSIKGKPVYICGGKLYLLNGKGALTITEHDAARPYLWPITHNVRPAAQSLGVRRCEDCHSTNAAFSFGQVAIDSPVISERNSIKKMAEFQDIDPVYMKAFALSFVFRPWLKVITLASCAILAAVLLLYLLKALARITTILAGKDEEIADGGQRTADSKKKVNAERYTLNAIRCFRRPVYLLALLCLVVLAINGFYPLLILGRHICGYCLILQVTTGGIFAGCLAVLALMSAHHCRFNNSDWQWLRQILKRKTQHQKRPSEALLVLGQKICFWMIILLALPLILSIVLSMLALFGTDGQEFLLSLHRWSALLFVLVAIVHTYLIILSRAGE